MLLAVEGLHAHYGKSHILHGVSLAVDAGEIVCLLGRNGVGKSTTLKSIMGLVAPSRLSGRGRTAAFIGCSEMKDNPRTTGTVAGGATGAAVGAAVDKDKPAEGAIIGGAVGAGAGNLAGEAYKENRKNND